MISLKNITSLSFLSLSILLALAIFSPQYDFWDGRLISHGFATLQTHAVKDWFFSSGWFIQYFIIYLVSFIPKLIPIDPFLILKTISYISLLGIAFESYLYSRRFFNLSPLESKIISIIVIIFPAWSALLSSVTFIYILCAWLVLLGVRLFMTTYSFLPIISGALLTLFSFQLNSNFLFSIGLSLSILLSSSGIYNIKSFLKSFVNYRFLSIFLLSVSSFTLLKLFFTPSGLYADYNHIEYNILDFAFFKDHIYNFISFPVALFLIVILFSLLFYVLGFIFNRRNKLLLFPAIKHSIITSAYGLFLFLFGCLPYILVGKSTSFLSVSDWSQRHAFLLAFPCALMLLGFLEFFQKIFLLSRISRIICLTLSLALIFILQAFGFVSKLASATYESGLISSLSSQSIPPKGFVSIQTTQKQRIKHRFYEVNWILNQAFGKEAWFGTINADKLSPPSWLIANTVNQTYLDKYIMKGFSPDCFTTIYVTSDSYNFLDIIKWTIIRVPPSNFTSKIYSKCLNHSSKKN